jgi:adenosylmethionine-8-amino-7-oxononanoate aminotransferase
MSSTDEILALEKRHLWPPYTQAATYFASPHPVIERAQGVFLFDTEGNRYYDMISSWWVNLHGHNHPAINAAMKAQLEKVSHCAMAGMTHEPGVRLAAELASLAPRGMTRVFFSDDGSTAVEVAMKMAFQYFQNRGETRRTKFAAMTGAYHGDTLGAVAAGGVDLFHQIFKPTLIPVVRTPAPSCGACPYGKTRTNCAAECAAQMLAALEPHAEELCAVLVEPLVQGAVGMHMYSPVVLQKLREFCDRHGILLIDDEVAMGFGRTGRVWACEHAGITPDILCAAKGLTGGYLPLAVTLATERVYEAFLGKPGDTRTFYHGHSFTGNPLAAAAALASMKLLREETLPGLPVREKALAKLLQEIAQKPWASDVRQTGMVGAFEVVQAGGAPFDPALGVGRRIALSAFGHGVYLRPLGDTIYLLPPLSITPEEIGDLGVRLQAAIEESLALQ